jgi:hypothetical protein
LAKGLYAKGFTVGRTTVARLLKQAGYRLQRTFKTKEGASHPDRDAQFRHINATAQAFLAAKNPVISIDAKKKELVGEYANGGREWHPGGQPVAVNGHDFPAGVPSLNLVDPGEWVSGGQGRRPLACRTAWTSIPMLRWSRPVRVLRRSTGVPSAMLAASRRMRPSPLEHGSWPESRAVIASPQRIWAMGGSPAAERRNLPMKAPRRSQTEWLMSSSTAASAA